MIDQKFFRQKMENSTWLVHCTVDDKEEIAEIHFYGKDEEKDAYAAGDGAKWGWSGLYDGKVRLITEGLHVVGMQTLEMDKYWGTHHPRVWSVINSKYIFDYKGV